MDRALLVTLCLAFFLALSVSTPAIAHDEDMVKKGRELGLAVGNAYACAGADEKAAFKADSEAIYALILHDLGPSYAYLYAVSVGFGASLPVSELDCEMLAEQWSGTRKTFELEGAK
jgi:hypothetical protein